MNCLECGEKIVGRSDKKFCDDACRNAFNNKQNKDTTNFMRVVNAKLRKNHRILSALPFLDGKAKAPADRLRAEGFEFDFFTQLKVYKNGSEYRFVYEIGYKFLDNDWLLIVRKEH